MCCSMLCYYCDRLLFSSQSLHGWTISVSNSFFSVCLQVFIDGKPTLVLLNTYRPNHMNNPITVHVHRLCFSRTYSDPLVCAVLGPSADKRTGNPSEVWHLAHCVECAWGEEERVDEARVAFFLAKSFPCRCFRAWGFCPLSGNEPLYFVP